MKIIIKSLIAISLLCLICVIGGCGSWWADDDDDHVNKNKSIPMHFQETSYQVNENDCKNFCKEWASDRSCKGVSFTYDAEDNGLCICDGMSCTDY